jgi:outer membrane protein OmpA-like peptidoglycan-associated protein
MERKEPLMPSQLTKVATVRFAIATFEYAKSEIDDATTTRIRNLGGVLAGQSGNWQTIYILGHAGAGGKHNRKHSLARANVIRNELVVGGVLPESIFAVGFGDNRLLVNVNPEDQAQRRAEVIIQGVKDVVTLQKILPSGLSITVE